MDRETPLLIAIIMLSLAALAVGVSGWVLLARDRRLRRGALAPAGVEAGHPEVSEES
jgi:hypothetical protein